MSTSHLESPPTSVTQNLTTRQAWRQTIDSARLLLIARNDPTAHEVAGTSMSAVAQHLETKYWAHMRDLPPYMRLSLIHPDKPQRLNLYASLDPLVPSSVYSHEGVSRLSTEQLWKKVVGSSQEGLEEITRWEAMTEYERIETASGRREMSRSESWPRTRLHSRKPSHFQIAAFYGSFYAEQCSARFPDTIGPSEAVILTSTVAEPSGLTLRAFNILSQRKSLPGREFDHKQASADWTDLQGEQAELEWLAETASAAGKVDLRDELQVEVERVSKKVDNLGMQITLMRKVKFSKGKGRQLEDESTLSSAGGSETEAGEIETTECERQAAPSMERSGSHDSLYD